MSELSKAIEKAIEDVKDFGSSNVSLRGNKSIQGEWEAMDEDSDYDVITIYILEDGVVKFRYQDKSTKVSL